MVRSSGSNRSKRSCTSFCGSIRLRFNLQLRWTASNRLDSVRKSTHNFLQVWKNEIPVGRWFKDRDRDQKMRSRRSLCTSRFSEIWQPWGDWSRFALTRKTGRHPPTRQGGFMTFQENTHWSRGRARPHQASACRGQCREYVGADHPGSGKVGLLDRWSCKDGQNRPDHHRTSSHDTEADGMFRAIHRPDHPGVSGARPGAYHAPATNT